MFEIYFVFDGETSSLLARDDACKLNLVQRVDEINELRAYGLLKCEPAKITLNHDSEPNKLNVPRRVPFLLVEKVNKELHRMETEGIIESVVEPTDWCAPMLLVMKKSGDIRICVGLKRLNEVAKCENFMLPTLEDISSKLVGSIYFSKLDAASGFYQLPLHPDSVKLTTFITPIGRFCFLRVPFGITSAPEIFQREMTRLLSNLEAIMDDILIFGKSIVEHDIRLKATMQRLIEAGLKLNSEKYEYRKSQIEYFGHTISSAVISPNPERVRAITAPTNVTDLRRILGMVNYQFISVNTCINVRFETLSFHVNVPQDN